jgi:hypothetical protein
VSRKKITEDFLAKEVWWWREGANKHPIDFKPDFALAFNYELARRACRRRRLVPFTELKIAHTWILATYLGTISVPQIPSRDAGNEKQEQEKGWTQIRPKFQWNLNLSERSLVEAFINYIHLNRQIQGIPAPSLPRERRRPFSWRWLEFMDLSHFKIRPLDNKERSSLSSARKTAKEKLALFDAAISAYWNMHREKNSWEGEDHEPAMDEWLSTYQAVNTPNKLWDNIWPQESVKQ